MLLSVDTGVHTEQDACRLSSVTVCPGIGLGNLLTDAVLLTYLIAPDTCLSQPVTLFLLILVCLLVLEYIHGTSFFTFHSSLFT